MESDLGKLFVGGISWDTNEDRLRDYFRSFGEVVEAVIMRDRVTGRARGFGFVVFADPVVAERVVAEKHSIDGRMVEAKKAVPRDDPHGANRGNGSAAHGSPGPAHTKKIFVGGLPSTVTESDFKKYFEQFGTISDVVVMYDHNTQRPRGFGFITYDSEEAVDTVLLKTFHELNGKMVEVKRAVPKELSPITTMRSPVGGYGYGLSRVGNFLNGYGQAYNLGSAGSISPRIDARFGSMPNSRNGYPPLGPVGYGLGMNFEPRSSPNYAGSGSYNSSIGYGRALSPFYNGSPSRYNGVIGYGSGQGGINPMISSNGRNIWSNANLNYPMNSSGSNGLLNSGNASTFGGFGGSGVNWGAATSSILSESSPGGPAYADGDLGLGDTIYSRRKGNSDLSSISMNGLYEGAYADLCGDGAISFDPNWGSAAKDLDGSAQLSYGLGRVASDVPDTNPAGYANAYNVTNRQPDRGIAA